MTGDLHPTVERAWCEWSRVGFDTASSADHDLLRWLPLVIDAASYDAEHFLYLARTHDSGTLGSSSDQLIVDAVYVALARQLRLEQVIRGRFVSAIDLPLWRIIDAIANAVTVPFDSLAAFISARRLEGWCDDRADEFARETPEMLTMEAFRAKLVGRVIEHVDWTDDRRTPAFGIRLVLDDATVMTVTSGFSERIAYAHRAVMNHRHSPATLTGTRWIDHAGEHASAHQLDGMYVQELTWVCTDGTLPRALVVAGEPPGGGLGEVRLTASASPSAPLVATRWRAEC